MNKKPFISIIIPVYNVESYLTQCLDSILNCKFQSYEILLVIGQSTDQSNHICYNYEHNYPQISIITQSGKGLSNARNCGFNVANGVYIMYVDSDDFIDSDSFDKTISLFYSLKNQSYDILVSDFLLVNNKNEIYGERSQIRYSSSIIEDSHYLKDFISNKGNYWNVWRYLYRRNFLLENNFTFKENYKSEDIDYSTKILLKAQTCCFYHNPYYCYRVRRAGSLVNVITMQNVDNLLNILTNSIEDISGTITFPYSKIIKNKLLLEYVYSFLLIKDIDINHKREAYIRIHSQKKILKETTEGKFIYFIISILGIPLVASILSFARKTHRLILRFR